jgi:hypothetical protein
MVGKMTTYVSRYLQLRENQTTMRSFDEYLNGKGTMQDKPHVKVLADKVEPNKGKGGAKIPKEARPIKGGKQAQIKEAKKGKKVEKGFGDQGDKDLIYDVEKGTKAAKIPTAESYAIFPVLREGLQTNPSMVETLVRDLKRNGLLGLLVGELSQHNETFSHLAEIMGHKEYGPDVCRKFARAMKENVAMPFSKIGDPNADPSLDPMADPTMDPNADPDAMVGDEDDDQMQDDDATGEFGDEEDPDLDPAADPDFDPDADPDADPSLDPSLDPNADPNADPSLDPSMDPNADPSGMGMPPMGDPTMNGPIPPLRRSHPALENFNNALRNVR